MHEAQDLILRVTAAYRAGDLDTYLACWDAQAELRPLGIKRTYRGADEIREFFEEAHRRSMHSDFELHAVVQHDGLALAFGTLPAGRSAFWVAEVRDSKLFSLEGFRCVGEAFDAFRPRAGQRQSAADHQRH